MSEREPTPAECEAHQRVYPPKDIRLQAVLADTSVRIILFADYVLDLADRIRRERQEQEGQE